MPARMVGVEMMHGFGDCVFAVPLMRKMSQDLGCPLGVAVKPACADAFHNVPWVDEIVHINELGTGEKALRALGYPVFHHLTPNMTFFGLRLKDPELSLIDAAAALGKEMGHWPFDQRPMVIPTPEEAAAADQFEDVPTIAIESVYHSFQSWASRDDINAIVTKYGHSHRILWLSDDQPPDHPSVYRTSHLSRRELIMCLRKASIFFSVGSGFFCAALGLPPHLQPARIACLWVDGFYKYEGRLATLRWHPDLTWLHNRAELDGYLTANSAFFL